MTLPVPPQHDTGSRALRGRVAPTLAGVALGGFVGVFVAALFVVLASGGGAGAAGGGDGGAMLEGAFVCCGGVFGSTGAVVGGLLGNRLGRLSGGPLTTPGSRTVDVCSYCGIDRSVARGLYCEVCQRAPK